MLLLRPFETQAHDGISSSDVRAAAQQQAREGFPGAVLVVQGGHVLLDRGIGAIGGELMRRTSRFWLASLGKQFTSAAVVEHACNSSYPDFIRTQIIGRFGLRDTGQIPAAHNPRGEKPSLRLQWGVLTLLHNYAK